MKALVGAFNQAKGPVGAFSVIVQPVVEPMEHYTALVLCVGFFSFDIDHSIDVNHVLCVTMDLCSPPLPLRAHCSSADDVNSYRPPRHVPPLLLNNCKYSIYIKIFVVFITVSVSR